MIARILTLGIKAEVLQITFLAGGIVGSLITGAFVAAALAGLPVARMIGGLI